MKSRLLLLWVIVGLLVLGAGIGLVWFGAQVRHEEFDRSQRVAKVTNDAFVEHTDRVVHQADNLLRAVRSHYLYTRSINQTRQFITSLGLEKDLYENIYVIDASGNVVIAHEAIEKERSTADREYFRFHQTTPDDVIYFAPTDKGRITNEYFFRITRRITLPDGAFGGVLLINVRPSALTDYFGRLSPNADNIASLVGMHDRKIRARYPAPDPSVFEQPTQTPLWHALAKARSGSYRGPSFVDGTVRDFIYQQVDDFPLVMVHGFSEADSDIKVMQRMRLVLVSTLSFCALLILMAVILTLVMRSRVLQQRYLIELQESNDRNNALFNATHEAVILLGAELPLDCNPQALNMFGASSKAQFLALPPWSPQITPPIQPDGSESEAYARQQIVTAIRNGTHRFELLHRRLDTGKEFQVGIFLTAIQFKGNLILQAVLHDITERIRTQQELQAANEQLARRNEEQDRFLSMLSHELKTPLAVIRMSLGTGAGSVDASSRTRLIRAVTDINAIVERCLQTDRLAHGRIEVSQTICQPGGLLRQVVDACSEPARVCVEIPALPDCVTDAQLLSVILANLIDNALKYGASDAPIHITATLSAHDGQDGLLFVVANPVGASGMPDPQQVFRRYYRAAGAHAKTGSGLGLHIAQGFARMLGGTLSYRPEANTVQFALWIPH